MKRTCCLVAAALSAGVAVASSTYVVCRDASSRTYRESGDVVPNPGQGWTTLAGRHAHYEKLLAVGAIYNRYDWTDFEPEDGRYDWTKLERDLEAARKHGIPACFRVMCANSGASRPVTPTWVWKKGARCRTWESVSYSGAVVTNTSPVFEDETFQRLHRRFLTALAAKYDGDPRLCGLDLGSYGNWGEWHCGKLPPQVPAELEPQFREEARQVRVGSRAGYELYLKVHASRKWRKADRLDREGMKPYVDMYLDNFKKTDVVFMTDGAEVLDYAVGDGSGSRVGLRRDGIGLEGHFKRWIGSPAYAHVTRMADVWKSKPVWFEGVRDCKAIISWGKGLFEYGFEFMLTNHVSLVNSFPFAPEQVADDPKCRPLIERINLFAGARLVPQSVEFERRGDALSLGLKGVNKGVAKIYLDYVATLEARDASGRVLHAVDLKTDVRSWLPGSFVLREMADWPTSVPSDARIVLRLRHRADVLRDFRFATPDLTSDGALPISF